MLCISAVAWWSPWLPVCVLIHSWLIMGCVGEEPKTGKAGSSSDLGRSESGKIEEQGHKKVWLYVYRLLVGTLVWPCPVPNHHSLSCLPVKFLSNSLLGEGL